MAGLLLLLVFRLENLSQQLGKQLHALASHVGGEALPESVLHEGQPHLHLLGSAHRCSSRVGVFSGRKICSSTG
jgi:hypothetical protein